MIWFLHVWKRRFWPVIRSPSQTIIFDSRQSKALHLTSGSIALLLGLTDLQKWAAKYLYTSPSCIPPSIGSINASFETLLIATSKWQSQTFQLFSNKLSYSVVATISKRGSTRHPWCYSSWNSSRWCGKTSTNWALQRFARKISRSLWEMGQQFERVCIAPQSRWQWRSLLLSLRLVVAMFWGVLRLGKRTAGRGRRDVMGSRWVSGTGVVETTFYCWWFNWTDGRVDLSMHGRGRLKMCMKP